MVGSVFRGWFVAGVAALGLVGGCVRGSIASPGTRPPSRADRGTPDAAKIYTVGEEHFARGEYEQAVELWRHAIVALPPTQQADSLRHALVLRRAYGQMMAWAQTGNLGYTLDAQQMLERYLVRHEELFGETDAALAERGQVYELLFEVERVVEPADEPADEPAVESDDTQPPADSDSDSAKFAHAKDGDDEYHRTIIVKTRPSVDDPETRERLNNGLSHPFVVDSNPFGPRNMWLTRAEIRPIHGPRSLLRRAGPARPANPETAAAVRRRTTRTLGRRVVAQSRDELKRCYEAAYARHPLDHAHSTVEVHVDAEGQIVDAKIVEGGIIDTLGDLCVVGTLRAAQLDTRPPTTEDGAPAAIVIPLTFFFQEEVLFNEGTGSHAGRGVIHAVDYKRPAEVPYKPPGSSKVRGRARGA